MKKLDTVLLILFPLLALFLSLLIKTDSFFISTLLFYLPPSIYLSFRCPKAVKKTIICSILWSLPVSLVIDYFVFINQTWFVPTSILKTRFFGIVPIEDLVWSFFLTYLIIIYYEYFLDKGKKNYKNSNIKHLFLFSFVCLIAFTIFGLLPKGVARIPYFYIKGGIVLIVIPLVSFISFFPKMLSKFLKVTVYVFVVTLLHELVGLKFNQWTFPSKEFIGYVTIWGQRMPLEEFVFCFVLVTSCTLSYYEFLADDRK